MARVRSPNQGTHKTAQKSDWRELATHIDADMRYKNTFTRVDVLKITTGLKNRCEELANLLNYEKNKARTDAALMKELEDAKMRAKTYQEKAQKIPDLKLKIEQHHAKLEQCLDVIRSSMIQNWVCMEFNKDLEALCSESSAPKDREMVTKIRDVQNQHNLISTQIQSDDFGEKLERIRTFTEETKAYLEAKQIEPAGQEGNPVIKIDLENMSSDSDGEDCQSVDFESEKDSFHIAHSQMDSEVQQIQLVDQTLNSLATGTNARKGTNASQQSEWAETPIKLQRSEAVGRVDQAA